MRSLSVAFGLTVAPHKPQLARRDQAASETLKRWPTSQPDIDTHDTAIELLTEPRSFIALGGRYHRNEVGTVIL